MKVFILATCRKPELLPAATLVFKTLRVGFPNNQVHVTLNTSVLGCEFSKIAEVADSESCVIDTEQTIHHEWIEDLVHNQDEPFIILDTDVVFHKQFDVTGLDQTYLSGDYVPQFFDKFSGCITMPRLHTSLLYIDPVEVGKRLDVWQSRILKTPFTPSAKVIHPMVIPVHGTNYFYDTCSVLFHAISGTKFGPEKLDCYDHLNCATWVDLAEKAYPGMSQIHQRIYDNPATAKQLRPLQREFYRNNAC